MQAKNGHVLILCELPFCSLRIIFRGSEMIAGFSSKEELNSSWVF
jgi:hypothetical protein